MRKVLRVTLPKYLVDLIKEEVEDGNYVNESDFIEKLLNEWFKEKALKEIKESEKEFKEGKCVKLKSLRDLR